LNCQDVSQEGIGHPKWHSDLLKLVSHITASIRSPDFPYRRLSQELKYQGCVKRIEQSEQGLWSQLARGSALLHHPGALRRGHLLPKPLFPPPTMDL
jgi:hypothetical protein